MTEVTGATTRQIDQAIWRVGRKVGRTIYLQLGDQPGDTDLLIGMMDTPDLARRVVEAMNARRVERAGQ
jgi:hypothetical protein